MNDSAPVAAPVLPNDRSVASPGDFDASLCALLQQSGKLDARGLQRAQRATEESRGNLVEALTRLGIVAERDLVAAIATVTGLSIANAEEFPLEPLLGDVLSERFLRDAQSLPIDCSDETITVAMVNPADGFTVAALQLATGRRVLRKIAAAADIAAAMDRLYGRTDADGASNSGTAGNDGATDVDIDRLRDLASEAPIVKFVDQVIAGAVAVKASDIHLEPFEDRVRIRYRVDGRLREVDSLPYAHRLPVVSRIKILANLNIAERRQPQDGRIQATVAGRSVDIRVATAPTLHGESVVLRLLHRDHVKLDLSALGFNGRGLEQLYKAFERPHGLILVTGPTGSGKTTTLYAALNRLNVIDRKLLTVEDPIEYQLPGVNQVQVNPRLGLTFANVLRSFLRHDPDVIMVGEIRDAETAEIAVHAALTGHLVLATLHTNNAASAITRLVEMGVEDFLVTSTVIAVVGQRLVRMICPACGRGDAAEADRAVPGMPCVQCHGSGFSGRTTISEIAVFDDALRQVVLRRAEAKAIQDAAVQSGMQTMLANGEAKVQAGITTMEEVLRVTSDA